MKTLYQAVCLIAIFAISSFAHAQSLQPAWDYSYDETVAGKQITGADIYSGSDGSVVLVVRSDNGGGGSYESKIVWLRANDDGSSPTAPLWTSTWIATLESTTVVAVRKNHLVYSTGRQIRSVTVDAAGTPTDSLVKEFSELDDDDGGNINFSVERGRAPGFVYSFSAHKDKGGFKFSANGPGIWPFLR